MREFMKSNIRPLLIPLLRGYIRYFPFAPGKKIVWRSVIGPYFQYADYPYVAETIFGGKFSGNTSDLIQRFIYYFGVWEPSLTHWLSKRLKPGDTFIDVGANIGYFSLLASSLVGEGGKVLSIEASPSIFGRLKDNLERNGARNVRALNVAVSNRGGKLSIYRAPMGNIGETSIFQGDGKEFECEVDAMPLENILAHEERKNLGVVKIDVEGAEYLVLDGMRNLIHECADLDVVVEINAHRLKEHGRTPADLFGLFESEGYKAYSIENSYDPLSYLSSARGSDPAPLRGGPTEQVDVIFTRRDI